MAKKIVGFIPARYASSRLPGKLLIPILGKTLLQRTYENAKNIYTEGICVVCDYSGNSDNHASMIICFLTLYIFQ